MAFEDQACLKLNDSSERQHKRFNTCILEGISSFDKDSIQNGVASCLLMDLDLIGTGNI